MDRMDWLGNSIMAKRGDTGGRRRQRHLLIVGIQG
jgi:hypothetical protein